MGDGSCKLNVTHSLAANLGAGYLNAAAFAYLALVADSFIFAAVALPVLLGSEYPFAEQSVLFGLECAVIDGFGLLDLAVRPASDLIGRRKTYFYGFKGIVFRPLTAPF